MSSELKLGRQLRDATVADIRIERRAKDGTRLSFPASSEEPVERWYGTEILSHDADAIRLKRLRAGAVPLLFNHMTDDPVGMVDDARIENGRLMVDAHLFDTERAREIGSMVEGGLRNVSIGYQVHTVQERVKEQEYLAIDWEPLEVSIVTVPADATVGIGRDADDQARPVRVVRAAEDSQPAAPAAASLERATMPDDKKAAAGAIAEPEVRQHASVTAQPAQPAQAPGAQDLENARIRAINYFAKANNIADNVRNHWIGTGASLEQVGEDILRILEERGRTNPQPASALGLTEKETREFSIARMILAVRDKDFSRVGFELECTREISKRLGAVPDPNKFYVPFDVQQRAVEIQRRDLTVATAGAGGYLVATQNVGFIELLRNRSVAMRMGAMRLTGLTGNVTVPRQSAAATAYWLANEATAITESQQTFVQMALAPKTVGAYTEISRQLLLQSNPAAEAIVTTDLASQVALAADLASINGSGAAGQPTGIINTAGVGSVTGTSIDFAKVLEFQTDVAAANVQPARGGYVTTPAVASLLIQRVKYTSTASPIWEGNVWDGQVVGFPAMSSNQMPAATMIFGDWASLVLAEWGTLEIEVNPYANFQAGIIGVRAMYTMDVGVRIPAAFSVASSIT